MATAIRTAQNWINLKQIAKMVLIDTSRYTTETENDTNYTNLQNAIDKQYQFISHKSLASLFKNLPSGITVMQNVDTINGNNTNAEWLASLDTAARNGVPSYLLQAFALGGEKNNAAGWAFLNRLNLLPQACKNDSESAAATPNNITQWLNNYPAKDQAEASSYLAHYLAIKFAESTTEKNKWATLCQKFGNLSNALPANKYLWNMQNDVANRLKEPQKTDFLNRIIDNSGGIAPGHQGPVGDCGIVAAINALGNSQHGRTIIDNMVKCSIQNGVRYFTVTIKGKTFSFNEKQIGEPKASTQNDNNPNLPVIEEALYRYYLKNPDRADTSKMGLLTRRATSDVLPLLANMQKLGGWCDNFNDITPSEIEEREQMLTNACGGNDRTKNYTNINMVVAGQVDGDGNIKLDKYTGDNTHAFTITGVNRKTGIITYTNPGDNTIKRTMTIDQFLKAPFTEIGYLPYQT